VKFHKYLVIFIISFFAFAGEIDDEEIIKNLEFYQVYEAMEDSEKNEDLEDYDIEEEIVDTASESEELLEEEV
jgi:hypothetical protein